MTIGKYLLNLGIQPHLKGFDYLSEALEMVVKDKSYLQNVTKRLYVELAKNNKKTQAGIEKAMRHAINLSNSKLSITKFLGTHAVELQSLKDI